MAAKQTAALIPLCHPLPLSHVRRRADARPRAATRSRRACAPRAQTGVEMEALTAVAVAALTIYDMVKAVDKSDGDRRHPPDVQEPAEERTTGEAGHDTDRRQIALIILVGVISPAAGLDDAAALRRSAAARLPAAHVHRSLGPRRAPPASARRRRRVHAVRRPRRFRSASRLRWIQGPAVGVGSLMFRSWSPALSSSPARAACARARSPSTCRRRLALARQLPRRAPRAGAHLGAGRARGPPCRCARCTAAHGHRRPGLDRASSRRRSPRRRHAGHGGPPPRSDGRRRQASRTSGSPARLDLLGTKRRRRARRPQTAETGR